MHARRAPRSAVWLAALGGAGFALAAFGAGLRPRMFSAAAAPEPAAAEPTALASAAASDDRRPTGVPSAAAPARAPRAASTAANLPTPPVPITPIEAIEPVRERDVYEALRALGARDAQALAVRARELLAGAGPQAEKVAALRALWDGDVPGAEGDLAWTVEQLPDASSPQGVSLPRFALGYLRERVDRDPRARRALERLADPARSGAPAELRELAMSALAEPSTAAAGGGSIE